MKPNNRCRTRLYTVIKVWNKLGIRNCIKRVFFLVFLLLLLFFGGSLIICVEPRYKNVDSPPPCKLKNILFFPMFFGKSHYSWNFTCISLNRKEIQRVVLIPVMQKFFLRHICIYLFLRQKRGIESYNLQGVYLCTLSFCCCWDRGWGALTHFYFLTSLKRRLVKIL